MYCPNCGAESTQGLKFCKRCGASVASSADVTAPKNFSVGLTAGFLGIIGAYTPAQIAAPPQSVGSVTEHTTCNFEPSRYSDAEAQIDER